MRIIQVTDYQEMSKKAALMMASQITLKPDTVLGLATGETPIGMYQELISLYERNQLDCSEVVTFNLDEYLGLSADHEQSYHYYMKKHFFEPIHIKEEHTHMLNGMTPDILAECERYEKEIKMAGGIDFQILGIGENGHIGFNEPDVNFEATTHLVTLDERTISSNSRFFCSKEEVPRQAVSMGIKTIMQSKKILLIANGAAKADAIEQMVYGKISPYVPATILQLHPDVTVIVDKLAGSRLMRESSFVR